MDLNKFFKAKFFAGAIFGIAAFIILALVFKVGMAVGTRKADFSHRWSDNYHRNFGGPRGGFLKGFDDKNFLEANGTVGQIIKINDSTLIVKGKNDVEKVILVNAKTVINRFRETVKLTDLKVDEYAVVIGEPNEEGQVEAKLIRVLPRPAEPPMETR